MVQNNFEEDIHYVNKRIELFVVLWILRLRIKVYCDKKDVTLNSKNDFVFISSFKIL